MKQYIRNSFLLNLGIVLLLCGVLYLLFFAALHNITHHGIEVRVPKVKDRQATAAVAALKNMGFAVHVDSAYEPAVRPFMVLRQVPDSGAIVKDGRTIFLTVNMVKPSKIPMPNLVNLSFGSAKMLLRNSKLRLGDTLYKADIASGSILEQRYKGAPIRPGEMIPQGSSITLVISTRAGSKTYDMPDVMALNLSDALLILSDYRLQISIVSNSQKTEIDTANAIVLDQYPRDYDSTGAPNQVTAGSKVILTLE